MRRWKQQEKTMNNKTVKRLKREMMKKATIEYGTEFLIPAVVFRNIKKAYLNGKLTKDLDVNNQKKTS